jgi:hypothetical protein
VTSRVRAAAAACLVASGLFVGGAGSAIALADPGHGRGDSDNRPGNDSLGDDLRRDIGGQGGNGQKGSAPADRPQSRWGNGRPGQGKPDGEKPDPGKPDDSEGSGGPKNPDDPKYPHWPKHPHGPKDPHDPKDPCDGDGGGDPGDPGDPGNPPPVNQPPTSTGGGGGGTEALPRFKPPKVPEMQLPDELKPDVPGLPGTPAALDAGAGVAAAAPAVGPAAPIVLPVIVVPPLGPLGAPGSAGAAGAPSSPPIGAPRGVPAEPPAGRIQPPANVGSNAAVPSASYRVGYTEYLRTAGLPQVAALAVPGLVGILVLTGAGGLVGYRQAKAGHAVRAGGTARFME